MRALPVRNCTRPEEILRRATYAEMPSRGTMLSDPMSMPSITTMIARLPANRVWQVEVRCLLTKSPLPSLCSTLPC